MAYLFIVAPAPLFLLSFLPLMVTDFEYDNVIDNDRETNIIFSYSSLSKTTMKKMMNSTMENSASSSFHLSDPVPYPPPINILWLTNLEWNRPPP